MKGRFRRVMLQEISAEGVHEGDPEYAVLSDLPFSEGEEVAMDHRRLTRSFESLEALNNHIYRCGTIIVAARQDVPGGDHLWKIYDITQQDNYYGTIWLE